MLLLATRTKPIINTKLGIQALKYSTVPKQAAGRFTSNKLISQPIEGHAKDAQKTLVYIGPFAETMRRYKMTASLFGVCGLIAVPALLSTGQAPAMSFIGIETVSFWGRFKEETMWLSQLGYRSTPKGITWQQKTGGKHVYTLEREIMEADPYLKALAGRIERREA
ncbi:hypothetical protein BD408DRAFT_353176 [Parasitella parasitica]|nr:hypothetical protein BD408DRAFT_353176 [Parasitella parasitica]